MTAPRISILVAIARNGVIGKNNRLPWHLPADLRYFKALTMGHHIVMGRKTFESIGRLLPGRTSVVVSRQRDYRVQGAVMAGSVEEALAACEGDSEVFIVGGAGLFRQCLDRAGRLYITEILEEFDGDVFFPEYNRDEWEETSRAKHRLDGRDGLEYDFVVYDRKPSL